MTYARSIRVRGVVQGVGFRPFVFRLAHANTLAGWVLNGEEGVEIHLEGAEPSLDAFLRDLQAQPPPAARITAVEVRSAEPGGFHDFSIRESRSHAQPSTRISPDLPVCDECLRELFDPSDRRYRYPYINCTNCGPRYTITQALPYDRHNTTMSAWPLDEVCSRQYHDPGDRRFHAQPVACPACGPHYFLISGDEIAPADEPSIRGRRGPAALRKNRRRQRAGRLSPRLRCRQPTPRASACASGNTERKSPSPSWRRDLESARALVHLTAEAEELMTSPARPIVLAPARSRSRESLPITTSLASCCPTRRSTTYCSPPALPRSW